MEEMVKLMFSKSINRFSIVFSVPAEKINEQTFLILNRWRKTQGEKLFNFTLKNDNSNKPFFVFQLLILILSRKQNIKRMHHIFCIPKKQNNEHKRVANFFSYFCCCSYFNWSINTSFLFS